ncbi:sterol desaturase family protein [Blastopirellula sp. J2-11]|uniref:sterol desaturase family protein n=1 Tax=Blastopirellula sp. J2-11 TaxID=2943192 RepID=UPI0021C9E5C0|nr:sterol desaturase family protein [Blastopirellula sp. J2-11]UUO05053.1 sterol desaturase family protein [Blastopirellula sp. J2-11]
MEYALPAILAGILAGLFVVERLLPLRRQTRSFWRRLLVNLVVSGLALLVAALVVQPAASWMMGSDGSPLGLLQWGEVPVWLDIVAGFLLLDLSFYYWHRLNHRIGFLWRFHNVHHIDPDMDVSTAFRFHFGEVAFSALFRVVQVTLIGMSIEAYLIYEFVFTANTMFHHSNVRLPIHVERWLNLCLVTPRMHGIHHSQIEQETNSNYSVVLPWWDRLHRSLRLNVSQDEIKIGVPGYSQPEDNTLWSLFLMPFRRQRNYWDSPDGQGAKQEASAEPQRPNRLAE